MSNPPRYIFIVNLSHVKTKQTLHGHYGHATGQYFRGNFDIARPSKFSTILTNFIMGACHAEQTPKQQNFYTSPPAIQI